MQGQILIVDDDPDIQVILSDNLELDGFSCLVASTGREALELLEKSGQIELIILDLSLPDVDGIKVCETIRRFSEVPIIMLTARDTIADKVLGLERGADDYLVKPFEYLELGARIKACLRRHLGHKPCPTKIVEFANLEINTEKKIVRKDGAKIYLTVKEFGLLLFLVGNAGKALTREEIRAALWKSNDLYTGSRTIDVHVQHLRKKIEDDPSDPKLILTVQGTGYILDSQIKNRSESAIRSVGIQNSR